MNSQDDEIIAFCGLKCHECPAYIATQMENQALLRQLLAQWQMAYNVTGISIGDILCDGSQTVGGRLNGYCARCPVRTCGISRGIPNCVHCKNHICNELEHMLVICERHTGFFAFANRARLTLGGIKSAISERKGLG